MQLVGVQPKDIFCLFEISKADLDKVKFFLDHSQVEYDGSNPKEKEAIEYITTTFNSVVNEAIKGIEDGYGSNTESG